MEEALIGYYKRHNKSYNITDGGERNIPNRLGIKHTPEAIEKIRQAGRRPCTESKKKKISNSLKGRIYIVPEHVRVKALQVVRKPVVQLTMDGDFIGEFSSTSEAEASLNKKSHHVSSCCRGSRKSAYGFKWMFKDEYCNTIS